MKPDKTIYPRSAAVEKKRAAERQALQRLHDLEDGGPLRLDVAELRRRLAKRNKK